MENKRVLVIGGTGYIGKEIVRLLRSKNYEVFVLSKQPGNGPFYLEGSVLDKSFLLDNLIDFDIIIYLVSIIRTLDKSKYKENVLGLKNTLEVMKTNNISKIIYFSTQNIFLKNTGGYGNSKKFAEKIIKNSSSDYIILRPNYVYGIDKNNDIYRLYNIIKKTGICPVIGSGETKFQPVNKTDIAEFILKKLEKWKGKNEVNISGPDTSINQIIRIIKQETKLGFIKIHIPFSLLKIFKFLIPFDVDGYNEDRISNSNTVKYDTDLREDIKSMVRLDRIKHRKY
ncbi:MAG: NAD-dependent epimerase/dehydratase family protein [archaeon]